MYFQIYEKKIFSLAHDNNQHFDDIRCFYRIRESFFISRLFKKLRTYIDHCFQCQLNQTKRHKTYEKLMSIFFSSISFHTVIMNFIMIISNDLNILLTITCKFSKRITIISDKSTYNVKDWVIKMMNRFLTVDWSIFAAIISDRNSKFLSEFWDTIFKRLNVFLLTSTTYHAQTNEQFERSNQTVEIAIRFFYSNDFDVNIVSALLTIQSQFNNSFNVFTDFAFNEIIYDFKVRDTISTLNQENLRDESFADKRKKYQAKTSDAIAFVNVKMKMYYDFRHTSLLLKSEKKVYLKFNKSYKLSKHHKKLFQQKCESFLIKRKVERLIYEFELFFIWKIHFIVSITQLKSKSNIEDSYNRFKSDHSNVVKVEENMKYDKFYEMKRIFAKRIRKYDRTAIIQYLIKWLEYESEFNEWKSLSSLDDCLNLVEEFEQKHRNTQTSQ